MSSDRFDILLTMEKSTYPNHLAEKRGSGWLR